MYITLYIELLCEKVKGASHGSGDCSELLHYTLPDSVSDKISLILSFLDTITLAYQRK